MPKQPYIRPQFTKPTRAEAEAVLRTRAIPGEARAGEMLEELNTRNRITRGAEIQKDLKKLYAKLSAFSDPTPADAPYEYEPEEIEAFEKLKQKIRFLEQELRGITNPPA